MLVYSAMARAHNLEKSSSGGQAPAPSPQVQVRYPAASPLRIGFAGDSISVQWSGRNGKSPLWWADTELYHADYDVDLVSAVGGTLSSHLLTTQIQQLEALSSVPDCVLVQTFQNDFIGSYATADTLFANIREYSERAIAAGVNLVVMCSRPPKNDVDDAASVGYINQLMYNYCSSVQGNFYCDVFGAWKQTSAEDSSGNVWRGTAFTTSAFSDDGVHPNAQACRAAAPAFVPVLEQMARRRTPITTSASDYDETDAPYNNVLDANGAFVGTGGQYNDVDNSGVAGVSQTQFNRWELEDENGVVATPSIVIGEDGHQYQRLTLSGTASADATIRLRYSFVKNVTLGAYSATAKIIWNNVQNISNWSFGVTNLGDSAANGGDTIVPLFTMNGETLPIIKSSSWSNSGFAQKFVDFTIQVRSGQTVSGSVDIGRAAIVRTD